MWLAVNINVLAHHSNHEQKVGVDLDKKILLWAFTSTHTFSIIGDNTNNFD